MTPPRTDEPTWEYQLGAWDSVARDALDVRLTRAEVAHEWRGASCVVAVDQRALVDRLIASLDTVGATPPPPPGWYPDPWGATPGRWWDGRQWTGFVVEAATPERSWIPSRHDHEHAIRGGMIAFLGFVAAIGASLLAALAVDLLGGSIHSLTALCAGQAALWICLFGACKIAVRRHGDGSLRQLGLAPITRGQVGTGLIVGLVARIGAGVLAVAIAQFFPKEQLRNTSEPVLRLSQGVLPIIVIATILMVGAPFFEELFFRGLVQGAFTNRFGARVAVFGQAACFGVVHFRVGMTAAQAVITIVSIGATGIMLGALRWHSEKLGPGMVAHAFFNAVVVLVIVLA